MDDTDRRLLVLIDANPRIHLQEMAKKLGISKQSVHRRIRILMKIGVIKGTASNISVRLLGAVPVAVFGKSRAPLVEEILNKLGRSEFTRRVVAAGGGFLYVTGLLRDVSDLDGYVRFVRENAEMPEPTVGIFAMNPELMPLYVVDGIGGRQPKNRELSPLDIKIVASLKDDARRPTAEIARMLGVSPKTVSRHLEGMVHDGSIEMSAPIDAPLGGDMLVMVHVTLREGADEIMVGERLLSKHRLLDQYARTFSNLPRFILLVCWSGDMAVIRRILRETGEDEDVLAVMPNFGYLERRYDTWVDRLPVESTLAAKRVVGRKRHPGHSTR